MQLDDVRTERLEWLQMKCSLCYTTVKNEFDENEMNSRHLVLLFGVHSA